MTSPAAQPVVLGFGKAIILAPPRSDLEALPYSWSAGRELLALNKRWRMDGRLIEVDGVLFGRISAQAARQTSQAPSYNTRMYNIVRSTPEMVTVPFAIRKADGVVVYQVNVNLGTYDVFPAALELALNYDGRYLWAVETLVQTMSFDVWLDRYPLVKDFDITVSRPNPHYFGAVEIEKAIEEVRAEAIRLVAQARSDGSLDASADLFRQAVDHVTRGYGKARVRAVDEQGSTTSEWYVTPGGPAGEVPVRQLRHVRAHQGVASDETLWHAIAEPPQGDLVRLRQFDDD